MINLKTIRDDTSRSVPPSEAEKKFDGIFVLRTNLFCPASRVLDHDSPNQSTIGALVPPHQVDRL